MPKVQASSMGASDADSDAGDSRTPWCLAAQIYPTFAFLGVQMCWSVAYGYITPILVTFNLSIETVGIVWFFSSLASCMTVPLVSAASDFSQNAWGRRRPFLGGFLIVGAGGLILLAYAESLGVWLGDTNEEQRYALSMAIIGLILGQVGLDGIQGMERGLCTDTLEADALQGVNSFFALQGSLGRLLGFGLGSINLAKAPGLSYLGSQTQILFLLSAGVLFVTTCATLVSSVEKHFIPQLYELFNGNFVSSAKRAVFGMKSLPKAVRLAAVSNLLAWSAFALLFYYGSYFYGAYIYGGDPEDTGKPDSLYERGVQAASFAFLLMAVVASFTSLILGSLAARVGLKRVWVASLVFAAAVFLGLFFLRPGNKAAALALFACLGLPLAASYQCPWSIVTVAVRRSENSALYCSLFRSISEVLPFALQGLMGSLLLSLFQGSSREVFVAASVLMAVAGVYTHNCVLDVQDVEEYEEEM